MPGSPRSIPSGDPMHRLHEPSGGPRPAARAARRRRMTPQRSAHGGRPGPPGPGSQQRCGRPAEEREVVQRMTRTCLVPVDESREPAVCDDPVVGAGVVVADELALSEAPRRLPPRARPRIVIAADGVVIAPQPRRGLSHLLIGGLADARIQRLAVEDARISPPSPSRPNTRGTPSRPTPARWRRRSWTAGVHRPVGRCTTGPRTGSSAYQTPPAPAGQVHALRHGPDG